MKLFLQHSFKFYQLSKDRSKNGLMFITGLLQRSNEDQLLAVQEMC